MRWVERYKNNAIEIIPKEYYKNILEGAYNRKKNMFQRIKLIKTRRKGIYNGRFKCAKV